MKGKYVIRSGKVRGEGKYMSPEADWVSVQWRAYRYTAKEAHLDAMWFEQFSGNNRGPCRVVRLVSRKP